MCLGRLLVWGAFIFILMQRSSNNIIFYRPIISAQEMKSKNLEEAEIKCGVNCSEKFQKVAQRVAMRLQEIESMRSP
jgi:hypothetical protein